MKRTTKRSTLIEMEQVTFYRDRSREGAKKCKLCDENSIMLPPALIAEFLEISSRLVYRLIETGDLHFVEDQSQQMLICTRSLSETLYKTGQHQLSFQIIEAAEKPDMRVRLTE